MPARPRRIIDLSTPVRTGHFRWPVDRRLLKSHAAGDGSEGTWAGWNLHGFTHMDAPRHVLPDGFTTDAITPEMTIGEAAVLDLSDVPENSPIEEARIATAEQMLAAEMDRSNRIAASESRLAELTRDYEVNRDLYQDLLRRRENARVSMNLDAERRGLSFRIQEPASLPLLPSGLRLMHVAAAGFVLALLLVPALLFALAKFDPRVRSADQIEREAGLPVLGTLPAYVTTYTRRRNLRRNALAASLFLSVPLVYTLVYGMKLAGAL